MISKKLLLFALSSCTAFTFVNAQPKDDGYRGIWYYNQPSKDLIGLACR